MAKNILGTNKFSLLFHNLIPSKVLFNYTISVLALNFINLLAGFISYRFIDPKFIGIWQMMLIVESYSVFLRLGIVNGMNRELPYAYGKNKIEKANKIAASTQAYNLSISIIILLLTPIIAVSIGRQNDLFIPIIAIGIIIANNYYSSYLFGTFRSKNDFGNLSKINFFDSLLRLITIFLIIKWGFMGYQTRLVIIPFIITLLTLYYCPTKVKPSFDVKILKLLAKTGLPIFFASYLYNIGTTFPKLIILKFGSLHALGIYSPVITIASIVSFVPMAIANYIYPKFSFQVAKDPTMLILIWRKYFLITFAMILFSIIATLFGLKFLPNIVDIWLPKYSESSKLISFGFLIGGLSCHFIVITFLSAVKSWRYLYLYIGLFLLTNYCSIYALTFTMPLINAVIWGQIVSSSIMITIALYISRKAILRYNRIK